MLLVISCILVLIFRKHKGLGTYILLGFGLQYLLSFPAGIYQTVSKLHGNPIWVNIAIPFLGWIFNMGGLTVRLVFEATAEPLEWLVGNRTMTVMSNVPYYAFLLAIQATAISLLIANRYKARKTSRDPVLILIVVIFLINSLVNVNWPWWGT